MEYNEYFQVNKIHFLEIPGWKKLINNLKGSMQFVVDLSDLTLEKNFNIIRSKSGLSCVQTNEILRSAIHTIKSMILCAGYGNIADVHILMRKLRDDLLFYLYIISAINDSNLLSEDKLTKQENNVHRWVNNELFNLNIKDILNSIMESNECKEISREFGLDNELKTIGRRLNNYTHGTGTRYYNRPYTRYSLDEIHKLSEEMGRMLDYILVSFVFLLILLSPMHIMSSDYMDYLDCSIKPKEGSQYLVAPFISKYLKKKSNLLGENALKYLRKKTSMKI